MRIVFHGRNTGFLAAFVAVLFLNENQGPEFPRLCSEAFKLLPELAKPRGKIIPIGRDNSNNLVCLLGRGKEKKIVIQALRGYSSIFLSKEMLICFDITRYENYFLRLGEILYQREKYKSAHKLLEYGIQLEYEKLGKELKEFSRRHRLSSHQEKMK